MSLFRKKLPSLVVANAATRSSALDADKCYSDCELITLYAPAGAGAGTIEVSQDGITWFGLVEGNTNVAVPIPVAGAAHVYTVLPPTGFFRIALGSPAGGITTFLCDGQWRAD